MEQDIDVRNIVGLLRRQAWVITSVVLIFLVVTAIIVYSITPKYTATTKVIVDVAAKDLLDPNEQTVYSSNDINARVESEVEILQSDNAILKVINDQNLLADEEFGVSVGLMDQIREYFNLTNPQQSSGDELLAQTLQKVRAAASIGRRDLTYVIGISFTSRDAEKAARLANAIAAAYIEQQVQSKVSRTLASRNIIQGQLGQANAAIVDSERNFDEYLSKNLDR
ncbi:Wzz/FepE/Etk N-terminal domain-containing protein, partial [Rhizobium sp. RU36D]|uniref:Wzz/FepE/Etk N-terminal domain-containing protein n=1 Tax=Rhizobium sp. RU36D TaxID=1907415 RepID=UPI0009D7C1C2